jgi:hypothetical protein
LDFGNSGFDVVEVNVRESVGDQGRVDDEMLVTVDRPYWTAVPVAEHRAYETLWTLSHDSTILSRRVVGGRGSKDCAVVDEGLAQ